MKFAYQITGRQYSVEIEKQGKATHAVVDGAPYNVESIKADQNSVSFKIGDSVFTAYTSSDGNLLWVHLNGHVYVLVPATDSGLSRGHPRGSDHGIAVEKIIRSPMPGQVRAVQVKPGDELHKGQVLLLLEAMKMEIRIQAPIAGRLKRIDVKTGQTVERDQTLAEIE